MPIRIPTSSTKDEADRRKAIYTEVEELLVPGFVSQQVLVAGLSLSMRSLYPGEIGLLRHRVGMRATDRMWKEWAVASSIWMLEGQCLLGDVNTPVRTRAALRLIPKSALDALFSVYTGLHNQVHRSIARLEAFCYEDQSRALWRMMGRESPARDEVVGIAGVGSLGMNHIQRLWVAYNLAEDDRQTWMQDWAAAKLVASAQSPKGVKRLNQRDESERKLEESRRKQVVERVYHEVTGLRVGEASGMMVYRSVTSEELVEEMDRWVRGEKDGHDQIIDAYKQQIRDKQEADRRRHEERMRALESLQAEVGSVGGASLVGYTPDQVRAIRGPEGLQRRGTPVASTSDPGRLYQKFVAKEIPAGGIGAGGRAVPIPSEMRGEGTGGGLTEQVARRQVRLTDDGGGG